MVKPTLEYGCCIWDPHLKTQTNNLEKVHKNAARFVTNNYSFIQGSTAHNMKKLGWIPLEEQRARNKVILFFKAIKNQIEIPMNDLNKSNRKSRHSDNETFIPPSSKNDCHMHSFFPNTVRLWNKLPLVVKSSTNVDTLKQRLQHITLRSS